MSSIITCPVCHGDGYLEQSDRESGEAYAITCPLAEVQSPIHAGPAGGCRGGKLALPLSPEVVAVVVERDDGELDHLYTPAPDCPDCNDTGWEGEHRPAAVDFEDFRPHRGNICPARCEAAAYRVHQEDERREAAYEAYIDSKIDEMRGK